MSVFVFTGSQVHLEREDEHHGMYGGLEKELKAMLDCFGFMWIDGHSFTSDHLLGQAPGEANTELAQMAGVAIIDGIMTEHPDAFVFGANHIIREDPSDDSMIKLLSYAPDSAAQLGLSRERLILISLLVQGNSSGGKGCGIATAHALAVAGFGERLAEGIYNSEDDHAAESFLATWRRDLADELRSNASQYLPRKRPEFAAKILDGDVLDIDMLLRYLYPIPSEGFRGVVLRKAPDVGGLAAFAKAHFSWGDSAGAIIRKFEACIFPGLAVAALIAAASALDENHCNRPVYVPLIQQVVLSRRSHSTCFVPEVRVTLMIDADTLMSIYVAGKCLDEAIEDAVPTKLRVWLPLAMLKLVLPNMVCTVTTQAGSEYGGPVLVPELLTPEPIEIRSSTELRAPAFAGIYQAIEYNQGDVKFAGAVQDDLEGEQEAMPDISAEDCIPIPEEQAKALAIPGGIEQLNTTVTNASKGVKEDTDKQYKRLAKKCLAFLHGRHLLDPGAKFFCERPPENAPLLIVAWIMDAHVPKLNLQS
ncbi:hypothetical protein D9615_006528 [Tricholomella constricta]|uniref:XPG-I domain-containing protein n=1 Tax=Tricholomella constricta TaxID=117010 RepID=A0A8H5M3I5_9AGAR|nr:hypothetical protein D9615_006528 [Tricholomella constricta]